MCLFLYFCDILHTKRVLSVFTLVTFISVACRKNAKTYQRTTFIFVAFFIPNQSMASVFAFVTFIPVAIFLLKSSVFSVLRTQSKRTFCRDFGDIPVTFFIQKLSLSLILWLLFPRKAYVLSIVFWLLLLWYFSYQRKRTFLWWFSYQRKMWLLYLLFWLLFQWHFSYPCKCMISIFYFCDIYSWDIIIT